VDRIEKLKEYLQASPTDSFLQHALGLEYVKLGDDKAARSYFEALLEANPGYVGSYYHLGKLWERSGNSEQAIEIYTEGMKQAKAVGDNHAYNELQGAKEDLEEY
jgi:tetratricopeptide (TPR) repeat protein